MVVKCLRVPVCADAYNLRNTMADINSDAVEWQTQPRNTLLIVNACHLQMCKNNTYHKQSQIQQTITLSRANAGGEGTAVSTGPCPISPCLPSGLVVKYEYELLELNGPNPHTVPIPNCELPNLEEFPCAFGQF